MKNIESNKGEIVMYQPDETIRLEVRMGEETVWLSANQMSLLFENAQGSGTLCILIPQAISDLRKAVCELRFLNSP